MTWRAAAISIALIAVMCWVDIIAGLSHGYTWTTEGHFPEAAVFLFVFVVLVLNVLIQLLRRRWGLTRPELMLIWCMLICGATIPSTGLMRFWFPMLAGPAYFSARTDITWRDTFLRHAPDDLVLTKDPKSVAARQFYEGRGEEGRIPWSRWLPPMVQWLAFIAVFFAAAVFMCAILRRQWVDKEHLLFPLARVPLEFTEGAGQAGLLPSVFGQKAFVVGFVGTAVFRLLRAVPVFLGADQPWNLMLPLSDVFQATPLRYTYFANFPLWYMPIGFAFLVPADVSLSIWFFYLFGRMELQTAAWANSPLHYGGTWSPLMRWQQAGSYFAFTVGAAYMMRRHLVEVFRSAVGLGKKPVDSGEPVPYRVAFWGLTFCVFAAGLWFCLHGMQWWTAALLMLILMCTQFVHARVVSQSGLYWTWLMWSPPDLLHSLTLGHALGPAGAVLAHMQHGTMMHNLYLAPAAMQSFRISTVFGRRKKWLAPAIGLAVVAAIAVSSWVYMEEAYDRGALNFSTNWGGVTNPQNMLNAAHQKIERPDQIAQAEWLPFGIGIGLTGVIMFLRARFYWWPIHSIGLLAISNWPADRMWLPFLLGWLTKVGMMKLGGGRAMARARLFFIGLILAEASMTFVAQIVGLASKGAIAGF